MTKISILPAESLKEGRSYIVEIIEDEGNVQYCTAQTMEEIKSFLDTIAKD